jgi:catechol 2,3-dioxygenase-like lactoylglutathione lyase family enzyme
MEGFVATKLDEFDRGKISRRKLIEMLTLAATGNLAAGSVNAQGAAPPLKVSIINHVSYTCPDFKQAGEWYAKVFNLETSYTRERELALTFAKMGELPMGITAKDVPPTFLLIRTRTGAPPNPRTAGRPAPECVIDHVGYTVADFNRERAKAELIAMGVKNVRDGGLHSLHMDDPFGYDVQISGLENNALTDG